MHFTHTVISSLTMLICISTATAQNATYANTTTTYTNTTTSKVIASQEWNNTLGGNKGIYICPEPNFQNGTRVKTDVCQWYATSHGAPTCQLIPFFANNKGSKPRLSAMISAGNTCLFFPNSDCRLQTDEMRYTCNGTMSPGGYMTYKDLYAATGENDTTIARSYACSMKGYAHVMTTAVQSAIDA